MKVFQNRKFYIKVEKVKAPGGGKIEFASLIKQPGTDVIPLLGKDTILLNYQYRPAIGKWIYQLPGGKIEKGETPAQNAMKELEEELGYKAGKMKLVAKVHTAPHITNDLQYIFLATNLRKTRPHLERGEMIRCRRMKIRDAIKMVQSGKITDSATMIGLLIIKDLINFA